MKRKAVPSYLLHGQTGRARAVWSDSSGRRHFRILPGLFDSPESRLAFAQLQLEIAASPLRSLDAGRQPFTINQLMLAFIEHAQKHYRRADGTNTDEFTEFKRVSKLVRAMFGDQAAAQFGPAKLKALRQGFIGKGWSRGFINQRIGKIRRIFKWGVSEELVPSSVYQALATVTGLQRGRSEARETDPVGPVDDAVVDATLPFLNRHVRGLVELQRLTGCRPGEACGIRRRDIDTGGTVWLWKPPHHKTAHRGRSRIIAIGPRGQALLREFFTASLDDHLFSPRRAQEERLAERAANRKTPRYPSHEARNKLKRKSQPLRAPAERYSRSSYELAIDQACDRAFPPPGDLARQPGETVAAWWGQWVKENGQKEWKPGRLSVEEREQLETWRKSHRWSPNQLRHSFATRVRKEDGLEAAGAVLGHAKMSATEVYAERDAQLAINVARRLG